MQNTLFLESFLHCLKEQSVHLFLLSDIIAILTFHLMISVYTIRVSVFYVYWEGGEGGVNLYWGIKCLRYAIFLSDCRLFFFWCINNCHPSPSNHQKKNESMEGGPDF